LTLPDNPYVFSDAFMDWLSWLMSIFQNWQPLIAGLLAVVAAICTIIVMRQQIQTSEKHHNDSVARKERSLRAQMANALSELIQYHKECYSYILRGDLNNDTLPVLPIEQLELLQKYIEYANSKTSEELVEMVHKYQVFKSRLRSFKNDRVN